MKVLISVASRHGGTTEIADAIARVLGEAGLEARSIPPGAVSSIEGYDAVILGSAVYMGRWLEAARSFAEHYRDALMARPLWLFSSGPIGDPPKPTAEPAEAATLRVKLGAREHRVFSGKLDRDELGFGEKVIASVIRADEGDFRPWSEIQVWAASIARELQPVLAPARR